MGQAKNTSKRTNGAAPKRPDQTRASNSGVSTPEQWKKAAQPIPQQELEVPSGQRCLVRPVGMEAFIKAGMIPNSLMDIIRDAIATGGQIKVDEDEVTPQQMADMMTLFDSVTCFCVVQPVVNPIPSQEELDANLAMQEAGVIEDGSLDLYGRFLDRLYVDEVDLLDKMFIMQFAVGGTRDLERFRQEQAAQLERVRSGEGAGSSAQ